MARPRYLRSLSGDQPWDDGDVWGDFGFSIVGAAFLLALIVPNLLWVRLGVPAGCDAGVESRALVIVERSGQVLTTAALLVFADTNLQGWSPWFSWLIAAIALMAAYEACWLRYFTSARTMSDFYRPLLSVPVPLATLPVAAFVLLGVYGRLLPLVLAAVVLGIGHVSIHLQHHHALARP